MQTRTIGRTGLEVTEISFGAAALGGLYRACPRDQAMATLQAAWDSGIRYFDVAPWYGFGLGERRVGDFLRDQPEDSYVLSTKVGRLMRPVPTDRVPNYGYVDPLPFDADYDYSYDGIMRSVEFSYARLGLNRIDILYVHDIGGYTHGKALNEHYLGQLLGSGLKALEELKSSGAIKAYGLGVNEIPVCLDVMHAADIDCILIAGRYTLLDRSAVAELLPLCEKKGTSLVVGGVFNSGVLAGNGKFNYGDAPAEVVEKVRRLTHVCERFDVPLPAAALQFPFAHPAVVSCVVGARSVAQLQQNIAWLERPIPAQYWEALSEEGLIAPNAPFPKGQA